MKKLTPEFSYFMGFAQSDGCLSDSERNRGKFTVELQESDEDFLYTLGDISGQKYSVRPRHRDTNFKKNYNSFVLTICSLEFRNYLKTLGMVSGRKDRVVAPPANVVEDDYVRGYYDGNGSIGFTAKRIPIVSVTTASDAVKNYIMHCILKHTGKTKDNNRNARDDVYNIALTAEDAVQFIRGLYSNPCVVLPRKMEFAKAVMGWNRPEGMIRVPNKMFWTPDQDKFILFHSYKESMSQLNRSLNSVKARYWRLTGKCPRQIKKGDMNG